jgi:hypothetical protein
LTEKATRKKKPFDDENERDDCYSCEGNVENSFFPTARATMIITMTTAVIVAVAVAVAVEVEVDVAAVAGQNCLSRYCC